MNRRMLFASLAALLAVLLALPVLAHPGRTDSKGGHYDHSSGTYHYHHGYPAHQHRDLDGDGSSLLFPGRDARPLCHQMAGPAGEAGSPLPPASMVSPRTRWCKYPDLKYALHF